MLISFIFFLLAVMLHALACHSHIIRNRVISFFIIGWMLGLALIILFIISDTPIITFLSGLALYAFLCELYIFLFTMIYSSISVSILLSLLKNNFDKNKLDDYK